MTLTWQTVNVALAAGLQTKSDIRASDPPYLDIARDVQFGEPGGVQPRLPFVAGVFGSNAIFGGGTLNNCRFMAVVNDELCVFTDTRIYSWNDQLAVWVLRDTHLAVSVDETPRFVTTGDQIDADRAELNNTIVWAWTEGTKVFAAAIDKATGSVLVSPTQVSTAVGRPKLVALSTKILLFVDAGSNNLTARAIDPAAPATAIAGAGTTVLATNYNAFYDAVRVPSADTAVVASRRVTTTAYSILKVTAALAVTSATPGRTCDGPIACAVDPTGVNIQIARANGTNIQGDLVSVSALADVFTAQALGTVTSTPVNQLTVAFSSTVSGGNFTAHAFWSFLETAGAGSTTFGTKHNTVTTANVVGTQSTLVLRNGVASRAFDRGGRVFVWLVFASDSTSFGTGSPLGIRAQLQNTYFLYRDDGLLISKATFQVAGGFAPSQGRLPSVIGSGDTFAWAGTWRRKIFNAENRTNYGARSIMDIVFSFDSNEARRSVQLGRTLYVSGGIPMQYDGQALAEVGFLVYPWAFATQDSGVAGNVDIGAHAWKGTIRWPNATGETERSTTATGEQQTLVAAHFVIFTIFNLFVTLKTNARPPSLEFWRTLANTGVDAPYYLITGLDPNVTTGDNPYIPNDTTSAGPVFNDNLSDALLSKREANPENGGVLESLAPNGAKVIIASDTRLFLGDVAGDPDNVWYSRLRDEGEIASFHDSLRIPVPRQGGRITALAFNNETLAVFRETAVYALPGDGFNNLGDGANYGPARAISLDVGAISQETVALTPRGVIFKSSKGWYLLTPSWSVEYIGAAVNAFDADTVLAVNVIESDHHVRILSNHRMLVWDYLTNPYGQQMIGQWGEWTIGDGLHAVMWRGQHVYLTATGPKIQSATYNGLTYGIDVETAWIKMANLQGAARCRWFALLGEWRSTFLARIRVARDYQYDGAGNPAYYDDVIWTPDTALVGNALQVQHSPSQGSCEAIKVRFTAVTEALRASLTTNEMDLQVATSGAVWNAEWFAADSMPGEMGNRVSLSIAFLSAEAAVDDIFPLDLPFDLDSPSSISVNDHFSWSLTLGRWVESVNTVGVLIIGSPTVGELEAAITNDSVLLKLNVADASPSKTIAMTSGTTSVGQLNSGAYGSPTGEACKLTGLSLDVGVRPGIYRRLAEGQRV